MSLAVRVPVGVVAVITPWNVPLVLSMRSVAPALALGNAVVLKPDPKTPVCGGFLLARIFETAGLPPGLLNVLPGGAEVGEALATAPKVRLVTFTGSTLVGRRVGELGGTQSETSVSGTRRQQRDDYSRRRRYRRRQFGRSMGIVLYTKVRSA